MNRTARLSALVEELRAAAPRPLTVGALAARFDVSTRTVRRDLRTADGRWYLIAWCRTRRAGRGFRLDRPAAAVPTGEQARPHDPAEHGDIGG